MYNRQEACRICGSRLTDAFNLAPTPLADRFLVTPQEEETFIPLTLAFCPSCCLVQLREMVDDTLLFGRDYGFFTSSSEKLDRYTKTYADWVIPKIKPRGLVVEIGSNDGTLLKILKKRGFTVLGVDPAGPPAAKAIGEGIPTLISSFNRKTSKHIIKLYGKADCIIGNNVLAHVDNLHDFAEGISELLANNAPAFFEFQYLPKLLEDNEFDNIYHEHRSFFALSPLIKLFDCYGLSIMTVMETPRQGGSIRVTLTHGQRQMDTVGRELLAKEKSLALDRRQTYTRLQQKALDIKRTLTKILQDLKAQGKTIYGYGASAKGCTLLNYCGISVDLIDCIYDLTSFKEGKFSPGMHIPITTHPESEPDYYLVLVWNYLDRILPQEKTYRARGGKFIVPVPKVTII